MIYQLVVAFVGTVIPLLQNLHLSLTNSPQGRCSGTS